MKIVTHDSSFHTDDVFAVATLLLVVGEAEIIRSREKEIIDSGDYVVDVGLVHDSSKKRFDHHQQGGAGEHDNGIPYASFGLVWKEYGTQLAGGERESELIERMLVMPIDAHDNGVPIADYRYESIREYTIGDYISSFISSEEENIDEIFKKSVDIAKDLLTREIAKAKLTIIGEDAVKNIYENAPDKRLIELPTEALPWVTVLGNLPEPLFVVYERRDKKWSVKAVPDLTKPFGHNRKNLPEAWAGKSNEELAQITGVSDAIFAHRASFMAATQSKEGALKLAEIALNA